MMMSKISTICYVHDSTERLTQEFTVKEVTAMLRLGVDDPTTIVYLEIKTYILLDRNIETQISKGLDA